MVGCNPMTDRIDIGQRLRFEVLKRDGFTCKYCGANATATLLEVDHVVAVANGGTNDPHNLVTACLACNRGKSAVPLDDLAIGPVPTAESIRAHAEQLAAYLAACKELQAARDELVDIVVDR